MSDSVALAALDPVPDVSGDMLPDAATCARIVEALLFASAEPLAPAQLREVLPTGADLGAALAALRRFYEERGVHLVEVDGRFAFRTAPELSSYLERCRREERKLSRAALETLAIIAYHQPMTRAEIENIRGVAINKGTLDVLMELGWVKPGKRREIPGRPLTWVTTPAFLDHFGLEKLADLPGMEDLRASGMLDSRAAIDAMPDLFAALAEKDVAEQGPRSDEESAIDLGLRTETLDEESEDEE